MSNAKEVRFPGIKDGDTFKIGDMEFIKFPSADGMTPVVMKDIPFSSAFGNNNNLKKSTVLEQLETKILQKIINVIGAENVCTFKTDLTTLDGLKPYGVMESQISLVTLDFYRTHVEIFDRYKPDRWWWLATPDSAPPHYSASWTLCVSPSGCINCVHYCNDLGVRPFLIFKSSIFESSES